MLSTLFWLVVVGGIGYFFLRHAGSGGCCGGGQSHACGQSTPKSANRQVDVPPDGQSGETLDMTASKSNGWAYAPEKKEE
jgi:hypothetical protein